MTLNPTEKHQSQIPALQLLVALGFKPLSQAEALRLRGGRRRNVVLDGILAEQLVGINRFTHRGQTCGFDADDAQEAMGRLKPAPDQRRGLQGTNQDVYDTLVLGTTIAKTMGGDTKSHSLRFVDWENPANNVFHVTVEFAVEGTVSGQVRRCDVVGFVNGIPVLVMESKRPSETLEKANSQLIGYQNADNVPQLFHFAQLLVTMNRREARYATVGASWKFWHPWRDKEDTDAAITTLINRDFSAAEREAVFAGGLASARPGWDAMAAAGNRVVTPQDRTIYGLCRPERLLDLIRRFTVFDGGIRKVARHQQFFAVRRAMDTVKQEDRNSGGRQGGVIWHTQGSGKSLTMVMLARSLALEPGIENPRVIIVTDRDDLDRQIKATFKSCEREPIRATSGVHLLDLIRNQTTLVTTIVNKFDTALQKGRLVDHDRNIFVLVDESHRSQTGRYGGHGQMAVRMRRLLPKACYLGFTGTPLLKKERNTLSSFGRLIHCYTINEAVTDQAVVPLLYEGRLIRQQVSGDGIDRWFDKISVGLTNHQKNDLKRKFSRMDALAQTDQAIGAKAFDISEHYRQHWQGTGYKAQLVAPSKAAAVRFKQVLDDIGHVSSAIVISPPNDREGNEEVDQDAKDLVRRFWSQMMKQYNSEEEYNRQIVEGFRGAGDPEILIVVSKLLTGFDAPRNTVLYICKSLKEHNLLQAIARVNRLYGEDNTTQEKQFGFILDYEGLLGDLDDALTTYSAFAGYDAADINGTVRDVREEIRRLPQLHEQLWDIFKTVRNKGDTEQLEQYLGDEAIREEFYERLRAFSRCLHVCLSSDKFPDVFGEKKADGLKQDWRHFSHLKRSVQRRYQETAPMQGFEPKIRKLLDDHVVAMPAETVVEVVNVNDPDALKAVVAETGISQASRADRIASATRRVITEKMEQDPALYMQFSQLLEATICAYRDRRLSERDYLSRVVDLAGKVARKERGQDVPQVIRGNDEAQAFFGVLAGCFCGNHGIQVDREQVAAMALDVVEMVNAHRIVDIWCNEEAQNNLRNAMDDFFFDVVRDQKGMALPNGESLDDLQDRIINLARARSS